jgi:hypothetical protein
MDGNKPVNIDDELLKLREEHNMTSKKEPAPPPPVDSAGRETMTAELPNSQETIHIDETTPPQWVDES